MNYGAREQINGLSSYFSFTYRDILLYSQDLGNSRMKQQFKISDFDQRTVLNELAERMSVIGAPGVAPVTAGLVDRCHGQHGPRARFTGRQTQRRRQK